jgi:hypothetical protein
MLTQSVIQQLRVSFLILASLLFAAQSDAADGKPNPGKPIAKRPLAGYSGYYYVPPDFLPVFNLRQISAGQPMIANVVHYKSNNGSPLTLLMTTSWSGKPGQEPRAAQRLIVLDGILATAVPKVLWDECGEPLRGDAWLPKSLQTELEGNLTVLSLTLFSGKQFSQNSKDGNPLVEVWWTGNSSGKVVTTYEDQNVGEGSERPDIIASITGVNVDFTFPMTKELDLQLKKRVATSYPPAPVPASCQKYMNAAESK